MLNLQDVFKIQTSNDLTEGNADRESTTFEKYIESCRTYVSQNLPQAYTDGTWDSATKEKELDNIITTFVQKHSVAVSGYVDADNKLQVEKLLNDVIASMRGAGILEKALDDPDVDEIQVNDMNTIFVVRKGVTVPYVDENNNPYKFINDSEITVVLNKLLDDKTGNTPQFSPGAPLLNAKTAAKQYRVNAVHNTANARGTYPNDYPVTTIVIRKFKETKLTFEDMVRGGSVTPKLARLLALVGRVNLNTFFVGPTASGKTTLLTAVAQSIPMRKRLCLVQNPTEISFWDRENGVNKRNVLHWEANDAADAERKNTNTMSNLISNALRVTPEVLILGEARASDEFAQLQRAMQTGHRVIGTYHAESAADAMERGASELSAGLGCSLQEAKRQWAKSCGVIISQFKFPDGSRKVMEVTEIGGCDAEGDVILNPIIRYDLKRAYKDKETGLDRVEGEFVMVNPISERFVTALIKDGVPEEMYSEFLKVGGAID